MKHALPFAAAVFALGFVGTAHAVDVVNEDQTTHQVIINDGEDIEVYDIDGGKKLANVCDSCVLQVTGHGTFKPSGRQVVVISGGKVEVKSN